MEGLNLIAEGLSNLQRGQGLIHNTTDLKSTLLYSSVVSSLTHSLIHSLHDTIFQFDDIVVFRPVELGLTPFPKRFFHYKLDSDLFTRNPLPQVP